MTTACKEHDARDFARLTAAFSWEIPRRYNIGVDVCDQWAADPARLALLHKSASGECMQYTFAELRILSNRAANLLESMGATRGDRIAVLLPQLPETAIAHIAIYKMGGIAVPMFSLFGVDALAYRLKDSGATAVVTDLAGAEKLRGLRASLPDLRTVFTI